MAHPLEVRSPNLDVNAKVQKEQQRTELNLTVRGEQRKKLEQVAALEHHSVSNLIEIMADERWKRLKVEKRKEKRVREREKGQSGLAPISRTRVRVVIAVSVQIRTERG